ncbi:MAG: serine protease [Myxococcales bacterium]|nr:serine protease [Myxococcales bacterium]
MVEVPDAPAVPTSPGGMGTSTHPVIRLSIAFGFVLLATISHSRALWAAHDERGVIGGHNAEPGAWPDVVAVYADSLAICTGVLVAPTVVLTAAHCNNSGLREVLIGAHTLAADHGGERIPVARRIEHPDWKTTYDVLVLVLARPSTRPPRAIASGWAGAELDDGTEATIVGFGAISADSMQYIDPLQEAKTTITDASCARAKGCNVDVRPAGELGAGGMGIDSCRGDSGGPLYAETSFGTVVAGLTSRAYADASQTCSEGGIYVRAGKIVDWIEAQAGVPVRRGPDPMFEPLSLQVGEGAQTHIEPNDPRARSHQFALVNAPTLGRVAVKGDGTVRMCATKPGTEQLIVEVRDAKAPTRKVYVTIPVTVSEGTDSGDCSLDVDSGCGCHSGGVGAGLLPLVLSLLALPRRRRRAE